LVDRYNHEWSAALDAYIFEPSSCGWLARNSSFSYWRARRGGFSAGVSTARMHIRRLATHVEVLAPAKVNLFLEVLTKRPDGYHELETLLVAVAIYDKLVFEAREGEEILLNCRWGLGDSASELARERQFDAAREAIFGDIPAGPQNLVWRAIARLRDAAGIKRGAAVWLIKRIPAAAGLGGASTDAAAALLAANEAWELHWPWQRLVELAAELGSDVPFFLTRGAAVCRGRGEQIEPLSVPRLHLIVVRPPVGLSTPLVFQGCRPASDPIRLTAIVAALRRGETDAAGKQLKNRLQSAAASLTPWIATLQDEFRKQGLLGHQMSGSGSSCFGLCHTARQARRIAARLRSRRMGAVSAAATAAN
jgi:4-diphosphocytidyl-2-C-methyl-D-erythritol kinase